MCEVHIFGRRFFSDILFEFRFSFEKLLFDRFSKYLFRLMNLLPRSGPTLPHLTVLVVGFPSLWHLSGAGSTFVVTLFNFLERPAIRIIGRSRRRVNYPQVL